MKRLIENSYLLVFCALLSLSMAREVIKIENWEINSQDKMEIYYLLNSTNNNKTNQFFVTVMISNDNGQTWFKAKSVSVNHGLQNSSRSKKIIIWDILSDKNKLKGKLLVKLIAKTKASTLSSIFFSRKYEHVSMISRTVNIRKKQPFPPTLYVQQIKFYEPSGNNQLDGEEEGYFEITIQNIGKGKAIDLAVDISPSKLVGVKYRIEGLIFTQKKMLGNINPGETKKYKIPITADIGITSKKVSLDFKFNEANNFPPKNSSFKFNVKSFSPPQLVLLEGSRINDPSGNGMIETGEVVELSRKIQNIGQGVAKNVIIKLTKGAHVFFTETTSNMQVIEFWMGDLDPGESKEFSFHFYANSKATQIPIFATIIESKGKYGLDKTRLDDIELNKRMKKFDFIADNDDDIEITKESGYGIDVRKNIPKTKMKNVDGVAVIIGNRDYENEIPSVDFALSDAEFVKQYLINTMGYDKQNIIHVENATLGTMIKVFLKAKNFYKEGKSDIFIYYSGHGSPDIESNQSYFVPVDADPNYIKKTGYALNDLYELLNELDAKSCTVVIDACFSGRTESGEMLLDDASPLAWSTESSQLIGENSAVFTSASGKQISSWYRGKKHSLFTYFFLKALQGDADQNNDKQLTILEIETYIDENVPYHARRIDREQTPEVDASNKDRVLVRY